MDDFSINGCGTDITDTGAGDDLNFRPTAFCIGCFETGTTDFNSGNTASKLREFDAGGFGICISDFSGGDSGSKLNKFDTGDCGTVATEFRGRDFDSNLEEFVTSRSETGVIHSGGGASKLDGTGSGGVMTGIRELKDGDFD